VACIPDGCVGTTCQGKDVCIMRGSSPECVDPRTLVSTEAIKVSVGGCGCRVGDADRSGAPWLLLAAGLWFLRRRQVKR
jgi:MYXO-CTERM domain-containing protein